MTCQEFLARYSDCLDGLVDPLEAARWRQHMEECGACARYDRVVRRGLELVRELPRIEPSPDFQLRLQHRLFHVRDERAEDRASGAGAVVALAIAGMLAAVAWSPVLRPEPFTVDLPPVRAGAPAASRAPASRPFSLPASWPEPQPAAAAASPAVLRWWALPALDPAAHGRGFDFAPAPFIRLPGPHSPLVVNAPDLGATQPRAFGAAAAAGGSGATLGRE